MRDSLKRLTRIHLLAALGASVALIGGCDDATHQADSSIREKLPIASTAAELDALGSNAAASGASRSQAKAALAQVELTAANTGRQAAERNQVEIARLVLESHQIGAHLISTSSLLDGFQKRDPKSVIEALQQKKADAQGSAEKAVWFDSDKGAKIPTLSALAQEITRIQGEIDKAEQTANNLTGQRNRMLEESESIERASTSVKGEKSIELFKQSAEFRKKAGDLTTRIDAIRATIPSLKKDLEVAQTQQAAVSAYIKGIDGQISELEQAWTTIQQQIAEQQAALKALAGGDPKTTKSQSIANASAEIAALIKKNKDAAAAAEKSYLSAIKHFDEAAKAADEYYRAIQSKITDPKLAGLQEQAAWKQSAQTFSSSIHRLQQAGAQVDRAALHTNQALSLANTARMLQEITPLLQSAGLPLPKDLDAAAITADITAERKSADEAFNEAANLLKGVSEAPTAPEDRRTAAKAQRVFVLWSWAGLADDLGDAKAADLRRAEASTLAQSLGEIPGLIFPGTSAPKTEAKAPAAPANAPAAAPAQ